MICRNSRGVFGRGLALWTTAVLGSTLLWAGCATAPQEPEVSSDDLDTIQQRVEEVERTSGRMSVRVEEMERQMSLLQDRVDSNRIALQRRGHLGQQNDRFVRIPGEQQAEQRRPGPAPESNYRQHQSADQYQQGYRADPRMRQRMEQRGVGRIPLSDEQSGHVHRSQTRQRQTGTAPSSQPSEQEAESSPERREGQGGEEPIVITNADLEERFGPSTSTTTTPTDSGGSSDDSDGQPAAQVPVTSERLPTSEELEDGDAGSPDRSRESSESGEDESAVDTAQFESASDEELLDLYQDSLAEYRSGDYAEALQGFTAFLEAGPRSDYIDNALYWIGECHYGLGEYDESVQYFQRILNDLPGANKVPDAMLKMSLAYDQLGQPHEAEQLLEKLVEQYPNTNPGRLGKERIEERTESR